jgi:putative FmdB family regulatory protein
MPTYEYKCENGHFYSEVRSISEIDSRTICFDPNCNSKLFRIYNAPSITFKGKGFNSKLG